MVVEDVDSAQEIVGMRESAVMHIDHAVWRRGHFGQVDNGFRLKGPKEVPDKIVIRHIPANKP
jgi:hypothetical protein